MTKAEQKALIEELTRERDEAEQSAAAYRHWLCDLATRAAHVGGLSEHEIEKHVALAINDGDNRRARYLPKYVRLPDWNPIEPQTPEDSRD